MDVERVLSVLPRGELKVMRFLLRWLLRVDYYGGCVAFGMRVPLIAFYFVLLTQGRVWIGGLDRDVTEEYLFDIFRASGFEATAVDVKQREGSHRSFAFVEFQVRPGSSPPPVPGGGVPSDTDLFEPLRSVSPGGTLGLAPSLVLSVVMHKKTLALPKPTLLDRPAAAPT